MGDPSDYLLQFFTFEHLPPHLRAASAPAAELARRMFDELPASPDKTAGLRKLLEAKDCFVRAVLAGRAVGSREVSSLEMPAHWTE